MRGKALPAWYLLLVVVLNMMLSASLHAQESADEDESADPEFREWLRDLIGEARERGIDESIIEQVLVPVTPIDSVLSNDRNQAEFVESLSEYLERRVTDWRIETGRERIARHRELLRQVTSEYGVPGRFIVAIWGIETNYGNFTGGTDVVRALATLAYDPRRSDYFRRELFGALEILQQGHIEPADMQGSWAGAMGQSQFMPSSFLDHAVDFDEDGRRDIWGSHADVFASIANYLDNSGWRTGYTWGREVTLPDDYQERARQWRQEDFDDSCSALREHTIQRPLNEWQADGVRRADGSDLPDSEVPASIIQPDGEEGPAFAVYDNFRALLRYNCADNYALAVARLADSFIGH